MMLVSGEQLLPCARWVCDRCPVQYSGPSVLAHVEETVTVWPAEAHTPKSRWLARTLLALSASAAAANAKGDREKDTMAPHGTNSYKKCPECFIPAPLKEPEGTMTLLDNCKRDQKRLWDQLSVVS